MLCLFLLMVAVGVLVISPAASASDPMFAAALTFEARNNPVSVFSADLDGDNDYDLAVANENSDDVSVLLNNGDGTFAAAVSYGVGGKPQAVLAADLDGDLHYDLAVANWQSDNVSILLNNGNGTYGSAVNYAAGDNPHSAV